MEVQVNLKQFVFEKQCFPFLMVSQKNEQCEKEKALAKKLLPVLNLPSPPIILLPVLSAGEPSDLYRQFLN